MTCLITVIFSIIFIITSGLLCAKLLGPEQPKKRIVSLGFEITAATVFIFYVFVPDVIINCQKSLFNPFVSFPSPVLILAVSVYSLALLTGALIRFIDYFNNNEDNPLMLKLTNAFSKYRKANKDPYVKIIMADGKEYQGECVSFNAKEATMTITDADNPGKKINLSLYKATDINFVNYPSPIEIIESRGATRVKKM